MRVACRFRLDKDAFLMLTVLICANAGPDSWDIVVLNTQKVFSHFLKSWLLQDAHDPDLQS
jgi:hypothetical protein